MNEDKKRQENEKILREFLKKHRENPEKYPLKQRVVPSRKRGTESDK